MEDLMEMQSDDNPEDSEDYTGTQVTEEIINNIT